MVASVPFGDSIAPLSSLLKERGRVRLVLGLLKGRAWVRLVVSQYLD